MHNYRSNSGMWRMTLRCQLRRIKSCSRLISSLPVRNSKSCYSSHSLKRTHLRSSRKYGKELKLNPTTSPSSRRFANLETERPNLKGKLSNFSLNLSSSSQIATEPTQKFRLQRPTANHSNRTLKICEVNFKRPEMTATRAKTKT